MRPIIFTITITITITIAAISTLPNSKLRSCTLRSTPRSSQNNGIVNHFIAVSCAYSIALVFSFYERTLNGTLYNTVSLFEDGEVHEKVYRKTHIPDGPGYQEKVSYKKTHNGMFLANCSVMSNV